jgi:RNA recognition motif-containing protein
VHIPTLKGRKAAVSSTLYLGNLPYDTSDEVLTNILKPLQGVTAVRVAVDKPTGELKGYIHIDFESEDAAVQASNHLENQEISGRALKVDYARTIPRSGARRSSQGTE